ncbi:hypothetical protein FRC17_004964 [Serendipita sp. 399]|nr:hypothetical protein FRC17_004964 [Serendipita sp. 399]
MGTRKVATFINSRDKVILLIGPTGSWKSSFINGVGQGDVAPVTNSVHPCTKVITAYRITSPDLDTSPVVLVDTPGFGTENVFDVYGRVVEWLQDTRIDKVSAIIFFFNITDNRFTNEDSKAWTMLEPFCGEEGIHTAVTVLTTQWHEYEKQKNMYDTREDQLKKKFMAGCRYKRLNCPGEPATAFTITREVVQVSPGCKLHVMSQMAEGQLYSQTDLGAAGEAAKKKEKGLHKLFSR